MALVADQAFVDKLLAGQIDLLRYEATVRARVLAVLTKMQAELSVVLQREDLTAFNKARTEAMLKEATAIIDRYYASATGELEFAMRGSAEVIARHTATAINASPMTVTIAAGLPTETFLARIVGNALIQGAASSDWWSKQAVDTSFKFANAVRQGMAAGETNEQIVARVAGSPRKGLPGIMDVARSNARALVHTSIQAAANESRMETYRKNAKDYEAVEWLATLDSHTCPICGARDLKRYTLDGEPINHALAWEGGPGVIHWGCRCIAVGIAKNIPGFKVPVGQRASSIGPVRGDTNFEAFLKRRGAAFAEESLGPGRAELFLRKKLTLEQLLSLDGRRLSLAQLRARYA